MKHKYSITNTYFSTRSFSTTTSSQLLHTRKFSLAQISRVPKCPVNCNFLHRRRQIFLVNLILIFYIFANIQPVPTLDEFNAFITNLHYRSDFFCVRRFFLQISYLLCKSALFLFNVAMLRLCSFRQKNNVCLVSN